MTRLDRQRRSRRRGQSLIEATLVLVVFFTFLLGVVDCGQVIFAHQSLVERVRSAVRWGVLRPWQGQEPILNMVLYGRPEAPSEDAPGYLGMTPANVEVRYRPRTQERPDDEMLTVAVVNFRSQFYTPWIGRVLISPRPVSISAPMEPQSALAAAPAGPTR
jgi:TadE-like protein